MEIENIDIQRLGVACREYDVDGLMEEPFLTGGVYLKLQVEHLIEKSALTDVRVSDAEQISSCSRPRLEVVITQLMVG